MNLEKLAKKELLDIAAKKKIPGRTKMTKAQLIDAIEPFYRSVEPPSKNTGEKPLGYESVVAAAPLPAAAVTEDLPIPDRYDYDSLYIMPVDPGRQYVYWEISYHTFNRAKSELRLSHSGLLLKIFMDENGEIKEAASVPVDKKGDWYFNIYAPEILLWSEIGFLDSNGAFHPILKSSPVRMPADKVSNVVDEETWMTRAEVLDKLYGLSGAGKRDLSGSDNLHTETAKRIFSHIASSGAVKER